MNFVMLNSSKNAALSNHTWCIKVTLTSKTQRCKCSFNVEVASFCLKIQHLAKLQGRHIFIPLTVDNAVIKQSGAVGSGGGAVFTSFSRLFLLLMNTSTC